MTYPGGAATATDRDAERPGRDGRRLVAGLAVTQTVGYGVLYYSFAALLNPVAHDLGTSPTVVTGALTLSVLVTGAVAIPVGRWLDRHGGRGLMTAGSVLGSLAVLGWSAVQNVPQLYLVFAAIGVACAMTLYEPAFAILVAVTDPARRAKALLTVTVVAGFASSIFIPLTGILIERYGWRTSVVLLAVVHAAVTVPLHAAALRDTRVAPPVTTAQGRRAAYRDPGFWLLTVGFVVHGGALAAIAVHLVSYLVSLGHPAPLAAAVTGLLGVLSVTGRVCYVGLTRWLPLHTVTAGVFVLQGAAVAALPWLGGTTVGAVSCVVAFGLGFGVATIARSVILADRYGTAGYATVAGTLNTPATFVKAAAPLGAAALAAVLDYTVVMYVVAATCLIAALCLAALRTVGNVGP